MILSRKLTFDEAVSIALQSNPRISLDRLNAQIAGEVTTEVRSAFQVFSQSAIKASQAASLSKMGGFVN